MFLTTMDNDATALAIPQSALLRLEFLMGEYSGTQTLYPPGGSPVTYKAFCHVSREVCERFIKIELYADIPDHGIESFTSFLTYSPTKRCYQKWLFSSSAEEPLHMSGNFEGGQLVMVSDPWNMPWGLQRLRGTFTSQSEESFKYLAEIWEPDGYKRFRESDFNLVPRSLLTPHRNLG